MQSRQRLSAFPSPRGSEALETLNQHLILGRNCAAQHPRYTTATTRRILCAPDILVCVIGRNRSEADVPNGNG